MTENQLKWILRLGLECDKEEDSLPYFVVKLMVALENNLFPETEPVFNGDDFAEVIGILEDIKNPKVIEVIAEYITKLDNQKEEVVAE